MNPRRLQAAWQALAPKDRRALTLAAVVLAAVALVQWGIVPAWRTVANTPQQLDAAQLELQRMQAMAQEAQALQARGTAGPGQASGTLATLQRITQQTLGDHAQLTPQGDRVKVSLTQAPGQELAQWLAQVRTQARVAAQEVQIETTGKPGPGAQWRGTVVLTGAGLQTP